VFSLQSFDEICKEMQDTATVVFATPNYEERSVYALGSILRARKEKNCDPSRIFVGLLWPRGDSQRVDLLEQLKQAYFEKLREPLESIKYEIKVITYPENYSPNVVVDFIAEGMLQFREEPVNIVVDISAMPRRMLVSVCDAMRAAAEGGSERRINVVFCYTSPQSYATVHYAQNVGAVQGYFSGRPIHECRAAHVSAVIFPSLQGYEGKLLFDELRNWTSRSVKAFVAVGGKDYLTALATMRANQFLLEQRDVGIIYYYSFQDGIAKLTGLLTQEVAQSLGGGPVHGNTERMFVVAPFGPKVFTLAAYFGLHDVRTKGGGRCGIEIAHVSSFQYLSLYSLGVGEMFFWKLEVHGGNSA
jgi:hypothetical protein